MDGNIKTYVGRTGRSARRIILIDVISSIGHASQLPFTVLFTPVDMLFDDLLFETSQFIYFITYKSKTKSQKYLIRSWDVFIDNQSRKL